MLTSLTPPNKNPRHDQLNFIRNVDYKFTRDEALLISFLADEPLQKTNYNVWKALLTTEMDTYYWPGPIWTSREVQKTLERQFQLTYPDWENVGPGIVTEEVDRPGTSALTGTKFHFTRSKDIAAKFPLDKTLPFSYPLVRPRRSKNIETTECSSLLSSGNRLDSMVLGGTVHVAHPVEKGGQGGRVTVSKFTPGSCFDVKGSEKSPFQKLKRVTYLPVPEPIEQLTCQQVGNFAFILSRSLNKVQLLSLTGDKGLRMRTDSIIDSHFPTSDSALSQVFPGMWSLACCDGVVRLYDAVGTKPIWHAHLSKDHMKSSNRKFYCDFGNHPQLLLLGNKSFVWMCDTRIRFQVNAKSGIPTLFSLKDLKKKLPDCKDISMFKQVDERSHVYVVTGDCVYVVDPRHDKMPVIQWRHMLSEPPCFTTTHRINNLDLIMVAESSNHKVSVIANDWVRSEGSCSMRCQGISMPKHFQTERDTADFGHSRGLWFSHQVTDRLATPWTGMTTVPNQENKSNFSFLSLYSNGDIFAQDFKLPVSQGKKGRENNLPLNSIQSGKSILGHWEEEVATVAAGHQVEKNLYCDGTTAFKKSFIANAELFKRDSEILASQSEIHAEKDYIMEHLAQLPRIKVAEAENKVKKENSRQIWDMSKNVQDLKKERSIKKGFQLKEQKWLNNLIDNYPEKDKSDVPGDSKPGKSSFIAHRYLPVDMTEVIEFDYLKKCKDSLAPKLLSSWENVIKESNHLLPHDNEIPGAKKSRENRLNDTGAESVSNAEELDNSVFNISDSQYIVPDLDIDSLHANSQVSFQNFCELSQDTPSPQRLAMQSSQLSVTQSSQVTAMQPSQSQLTTMQSSQSQLTAMQSSQSQLTAMQSPQLTAKRPKLMNKKPKKKRLDGF